MNYKKFGVYFLVALIFFGSLSFVTSQKSSNSDDSSDILMNIAKTLLGDMSGSIEEVLVIKSLILLIAVLFFASALTSIDTFKDRRGTAWVISIILALIGARFLPAQQISGLFIGTSAIIIGMFLAIQAAFLFWASHRVFKDSKILRRILFYVWGAMLLYLLIKYGIWNWENVDWVKALIISPLRLIGITKPTYILSKLVVFLYLIAIFASTALGGWLGDRIAKGWKEDELHELGEKAESAIDKAVTGVRAFGRGAQGLAAADDGII